jgi:hypothetical protein
VSFLVDRIMESHCRQETKRPRQMHCASCVQWILDRPLFRSTAHPIVLDQMSTNIHVQCNPIQLCPTKISP